MVDNATPTERFRVANQYVLLTLRYIWSSLGCTAVELAILSVE